MPFERFTMISDADQLKLSAYRQRPNKVVSILVISHGLGEHAQRYQHFAESLTLNNIATYALDHRGHGDSIEGDTPGCFGEAGWQGLVSDLAQLVRIAHEENPNLPLTLLGHSMGSFAAQSYLLKHSGDITALILSGSAALEKLVEAQIEAMSNEESGFNLFNQAFTPARTDFDWLSRNEAEVDKYIADPLCGFELDESSTMSMLGAAAALADQDQINLIENKAPLLLAAGSMDPVTGQLAFLEVLLARYKAAGFIDIEKQYYEGARHEILNETNREEVEEAMIEWIQRTV